MTLIVLRQSVLKFLTNKQISFLLFNEADYSSRKFAVSRGVLSLAVMFFLAVVCLTGFAAVRCNALRRTITAAALVEEASRDQRHRVTVQGRQIDLLNEKLAELTEKFEHLRSQKTEICRIGRIEQTVDNENLFGVGGSRFHDTTTAAGTEHPAGPDKGSEPDSAAKPVASNVHPSDSPAISGSDFLLSPSDFHINPIACIPSSLPLNGAVSKAPRSPRQSVAAGSDPQCGLMLEAVQGDEILAPANGIVTFVDENKSGAGYWVIIDHGHGIIARYTGLTSAARKAGELVLKGEVIGLAEKSLPEKPSRFYYEIMVDGLPVHPEKLIGRTAFLQ